jgi:hypothetical protein
MSAEILLAPQNRLLIFHRAGSTSLHPGLFPLRVALRAQPAEVFVVNFVGVLRFPTGLRILPINAAAAGASVGPFAWQMARLTSWVVFAAV